MGFGDWFSDSIASPVYHGFGEAKDYVHESIKDLTGANAAEEAAQLQASAADKDLAFRQKVYDDQIKLNEPWRNAGISALSDLSGGIKSGAFESPENEFKDTVPGFKFDFQADPGYQFRQQQAQQAIERSAAAGGGLFSGATMSDLAKKSGQMASDEYDNAYNRSRGEYQDRVANRNFNYGVFSDSQNAKRQKLNDRFSRLSTLAGFGDAGASRTQQAGSTFGDAASASILGKANAQASGIVGSANAQQQGIMGLAGLAAKIYGAA